MPSGSSVVIFSWGPNAPWVTEKAGNQVRRLLAAGTRCPTRSYHATFRLDDAALSTSGCSQADGTVIAVKAMWDSETSRLRQVLACVARVGLRVSDEECRNAAARMGQFHMPDDAAEMVVELFIRPLVASVELAQSRQRMFDILRTDAPFSGVAEYVECLPEAALRSVDIAYWVRHFLVSQCAGRVPPSLDGLRVGGEPKSVSNVSVSAVSTAEVRAEITDSTADPGFLQTVDRQLLGPLSDGY